MDRVKALKILLIENDVVLADVARELGYTRGHVTNVLKGRDRSPRVVEAVARRVGMDADGFAAQYLPRRAA